MIVDILFSCRIITRSRWSKKAVLSQGNRMLLYPTSPPPYIHLYSPNLVAVTT